MYGRMLASRTADQASVKRGGRAGATAVSAAGVPPSLTGTSGPTPSLARALATSSVATEVDVEVDADIIQASTSSGSSTISPGSPRPASGASAQTVSSTS